MDIGEKLSSNIAENKKVESSEWFKKLIQPAKYVGNYFLSIMKLPELSFMINRDGM